MYLVNIVNYIFDGASEGTSRPRENTFGVNAMARYQMIMMIIIMIIINVIVVIIIIMMIVVVVVVVVTWF